MRPKPTATTPSARRARRGRVLFAAGVSVGALAMMHGALQWWGDLAAFRQALDRAPLVWWSLPSSLIFWAFGVCMLWSTVAGFVAEIQIFIGAFAVYPVAAGIGLLGLLVTAALFLQLLQKLFFGPLPEARRGFPDLRAAETAVLGALLGLTLLVGVYPRWLLDVVDATSRLVTGGR